MGDDCFPWCWHSQSNHELACQELLRWRGHVAPLSIGLGSPALHLDSECLGQRDVQGIETRRAEITISPFNIQTVHGHSARAIAHFKAGDLVSSLISDRVGIFLCVTTRFTFLTNCEDVEHTE